MKNRFTRIIPILLVSLVLIFAISCKKKNVKKIAVDNQFAISLFSDSMSMMDVLGLMDSTTNQWLRVKPDGSIWAYYDNRMDSVIKASDLLGEIEDMTIEPTTTTFSLPTTPKSFIDTLRVDKFASFPVNFAGFEIVSVEMRTGMLGFSIELNEQIDMLKTIIITTNSIILQNGEPLSLNLEMTGTSASDAVDLANCILIPDENNSVSFSAAIVMDIDPMTYTGGDYECTISGGITDVGFKTVHGIINKSLNQVFDNSLEINFGINGVDGDLFLPIPNVNLIYNNTFGLGTECKINKLRLVNASTGVEANLLGDGVDSIMVDVYPTGVDTVYHTITGFNQAVNIMEHYSNFEFKGGIDMLFDENGQVSVSDTSVISVIGNVEMQMKCQISDLKYCDTLDVNLGGDMPENNYFSEIDFFIDADSKIKLDMDLQLLFLNDNNVVVDSLFDGQHTINYNEANTLETIITNERIDRIMNAKKIVMRITISTDNHEMVEFNVADRLALRVRMLTKASEISME